MALVKHNNNSISAVTSMASLSTGSMTLIKEVTASSDANIDFIDGSGGVVLDSTYPIYKFEYHDIHLQTDRKDFQFNFTTDGTNFNVTKTTTAIECYHFESDSATAFGYRTDLDLAQSTSDQILMYGLGNDNDQSGVGYIFIFNPSSTTFVKHFLSDNHFSEGQNIAFRQPVAGYANTTSAITGVRFKMNSGNIDAGTIKLYGIKDS